MRRFTTILALLLASCAANDDVIVVRLMPEPGPGRISTHWRDYGPSSDPLGGRKDLSGETLQGIPDTLGDLHVRFIDFQWDLILHDAFVNGRIDSAEYEADRDPTLQVALPDAPFDQHVHYVVGRNAGGDFVVVFDTDNDEDLSDERALVFPWQGPPIDIMESNSQVNSTAGYLRQVGSWPRTTVSVQLSDGEKVYDSRVILAMAPHLTNLNLVGGSDEPIAVATHLAGAYQNMVGTTTIGGDEYTFWVGAARMGGYRSRDTKVWFEKGDQRGAPVDSTQPFAANPFLIGQVIDVEGRYYRLDDVRLDGSELRLVEVESMPGVGIRPGQDAPEFMSVTIDGDGLKLSDYRGKYVLLDFWATSCGPCLKALPELRGLYGEIEQEDFEIIGIAEDEPEWLRQFVSDNGIAWPQVTQDRSEETRRDILDKYRVTGIPAYFLIDPQGRVAKAGRHAAPSALADSLHVWITGQSG